LFQIAVSVSPAQAFCVKLDPNPKTITIKPGESVNITISISTALNIDYGTEVFKATGLPLNTEYAFSPSTIPYQNGYQGTAYLTIKTSQNTPEGTYQVTIHLIGSGPDSGEGNTATITLIITSTSPTTTITPTTTPTVQVNTLSTALLYIIIGIILVIIAVIIITIIRRH
jgi:uncharacterized membrane protein